MGAKDATASGTATGKFIGMLIVATAMLGLIFFLKMVGFDLTPVENVHLDKVVVVEGYANAFCDAYKGKSGELNKQCGDLTKKNCLSADCCVYAKMNGDEKCLAGNEHGPTFRFNEDGKTNDIDYYFYKKKFYGKSCK